MLIVIPTSGNLNSCPSVSSNLKNGEITMLQGFSQSMLDHQYPSGTSDITQKHLGHITSIVAVGKITELQKQPINVGRVALKRLVSGWLLQ